jgi:APA family basic amino acid/polyamine antiporter
MTELARRLGLGDAVFLVIGSVFGSGIFLTTGIIAYDLPAPGLIWLVWAVGGLLTIIGALIYAELGTLFPGAGGPYIYLKEAYGPQISFLYGWTFFWIIGGGGIAALAMGFAENLGSFFPFLSPMEDLVRLSFGPLQLHLSAGHVAAVLSIIVLSVLNYLGVQSGVRFQNVFTAFRLIALAAFAGLAFAIGRKPGLQNLTPFMPHGPLPSLSMFGAAFLAVLWTYDGWYSVNCTAEEVRNPARTIPRALVLGTAAVTALYLLANIVYSMALPVERMRGVVRIGESAAAGLFGPGGARLFSAFIAAAVLGCLSANILFSPRVSFAMARDGLFFKSLAYVHPRYRVPANAILAQMVWSVVLCFSGSYQSLIEFVAFALLLFFAATGFAVFILRRKAPGRERPFKAWGYPVLPALYVLINLTVFIAVFFSRPVQSLAGAAVICAGLPAYFFWTARRRKSQAEGDRT